MLYKSGNSIEFLAEKFTMRESSKGSIEEIKWTSLNGNRPILIGIENIEAIYQIGHFYRFNWRALLE